MSKAKLVVTSDPEKTTLSQKHAEVVCDQLKRTGLGGHDHAFAGPSSYDVTLDAEDFSFSHEGASDRVSGFAHLFDLEEEPQFRDADYNIVATQSRRKKLLVADMESTIIEQECLDELADYVGLRDRVSEITERAMQGELDFEEALRERVRLLRGLSIDLLEDLYTSKVTLMSGAETLVATMAANGAHCALVSGGFTWFTSRIAQRLGFQSHQANELIIENGKLTGEVGMPILGRAAKKQALDRLCRELNITPTDAITVGDGANDLDMLTAAGEAGGIGVAFHAKPLVAQTAPHRIDHGDLTALLYLQGYTQDAFASPK